MGLPIFEPTVLGQASHGLGQASHGLGQASIEHQEYVMHLMMNRGAARAERGAVRDGTGKEVEYPKSFIEELQAETNEWLGEEWT